MGDIKINEKLIFSQTGSDEPVLASNVDLSSATVGSGFFILVR